MTDKDKESFSNTVFYWQNIGLEQFTLAAQAKGYGLTEEFEWDSLDELERYILDEKVSHTSQAEEQMTKFVGAYQYLGEVVNKRYKTDWALCEDDTIDKGLAVIPGVNKFGVDFVPRHAIIVAILGRLKTNGLKGFIEKFANPIPFKSAINDMPTEDV
jgi:hypothetical protein